MSVKCPASQKIQNNPLDGFSMSENFSEAGLNFWTFLCVFEKGSTALTVSKNESCRESLSYCIIQARCLNHHQFYSLLTDKDLTRGLPYHTKAKLLSQVGKVFIWFMTVAFVVTVAWVNMEDGHILLRFHILFWRHLRLEINGSYEVRVSSKTNGKI